MTQTIDLTQIKQTTDMRPPRLVLFGQEKIGKSTFASDAPDVLFADIEGGLDGIKSAKQKIESWPGMVNLITALHEQEHGFKTLAVDSIDWLEKLMHKQVAEENQKENVEDIGYGRGYKLALDLWAQFLNGMTSLRDNKGMTIILLAHSQVKKYNNPSMESYDRYTLKLHDAAGAFVTEWADAIMFAHKKIRIEKEDAGFNKKVAKARDIGDMRVMATVESASFLAGHRASLNLPDEIPFSWAAFIDAVGQGKKKAA